MNYEIKRRQYVDIWGEAFKLYIDNFLPLVLLGAIGSIPLVILYAVQPFAAVNAETQVDVMTLIIWMIMVLTSNSLSQGLLLQYISKRYLKVRLNFGQYIENIIPIFFPLLGISFIISLMIFVGLMAFAIPGIFLMLTLSLTISVMIVERLSIQNSIMRSVFLTRGNKGEIFFLSLIFLLISFGLDRILQFLFLLIDSLQMPVNPEYILIVITQSLLSPYGACLFILIYFNMRIEKEGFTVDKLTSVE